MTLLRQSLTIGFIVGSVFLLLAPLGLGIAFFEFLRPILAPGIVWLQWLYPKLLVGQGDQMFWSVALLLNGLVYSVVLFVILGAKRFLARSGA